MRDDTGMLVSYLEHQKIDGGLISDVKAFREAYETEEKVRDRLTVPDMLFYGKDILEMSIAALLQGENLLLSGAKATGSGVRPWHGYLEDPLTISPFMSIRIVHP